MGERRTRIVALLLVLLVASGCGIQEGVKSRRGRGDAPHFPTSKIDGRTVDGVTEWIDGWGNVSTKCVWNGYRGFQTTKSKGASSLVVVADPKCKYVKTGPQYKDLSHG